MSRHRGRADLDLPPRWEVQVCRLWLRLFARRRASMNTKVSSIGVKHLVDRWASTFTPRTVGSSAVIQAAIEEGYQLRPCRFGVPGAHFDVSLALWTRFEARHGSR
jgi:hypothetical protein